MDDQPTPPAPPAPSATALRLTAHVLLLGERLDTVGLERSDVISTTPLAFRVGEGGYASCSAMASPCWWG
jgi:hypothetical protein